MVDVQRNEWVLRGQFLGGHHSFGPAHVSGGVEDLALQVIIIDSIKIEQAEGAHSRGGQVLQYRTAQAATAHDQHPGGFELLLAGHANFRQQQVATVARGFGGRKRRGAHRARAVRVASQSFHTGS